MAPLSVLAHLRPQTSLFDARTESVSPAIATITSPEHHQQVCGMRHAGNRLTPLAMLAAPRSKSSHRRRFSMFPNNLQLHRLWKLAKSQCHLHHPGLYSKLHRILHEYKRHIYISFVQCKLGLNLGLNLNLSLGLRFSFNNSHL